MNTATLIDTKRSDAALCRNVVNYLSSPEFPRLQKIEVEVTDAIVTLRGPVKSFYARQLLVHGCQRVPRVAGVVDELYVLSGLRSRRPQTVK